MTRANDEAAQGPAQHDEMPDAVLTSSAELDDDAACAAAEEEILKATDVTDATLSPSVKHMPSPPADDAERAEILMNLMYGLSEECLNLAHYESEPAKRNSLVQAGLSTANGWMRMSDLRDKLNAKKR